MLHANKVWNSPLLLIEVSGQKAIHSLKCTPICSICLIVLVLPICLYRKNTSCDYHICLQSSIYYNRCDMSMLDNPQFYMPTTNHQSMIVERLFCKQLPAIAWRGGEQSGIPQNKRNWRGIVSWRAFLSSFSRRPLYHQVIFPALMSRKTVINIAIRTVDITQVSCQKQITKFFVDFRKGT